MQAVKSPHLGGTIGIISGDLSRFPSFYVSLMNIQVPAGSCWSWIRGNGIAQNRNMVVRDMQGEWIWFLDDDQTFEPDTLLRLLNREVDIIQPLIATRKPPFYPYGYNRGEKGYGGGDWPSVPPTGIREWDAVGTGGTLIRRRVFDKIADPWFEEGAEDKETLGEDLYFMTKARRLGFKCFVDSDVRMGHITTAEVWPAQTNEGKWCIDLDLSGGVRIRTDISLGRRIAREDK